MLTKIYRFTASWCVPCGTLKKNLETLDPNVPIETVDIDMNDGLVKLYGIRSVPTLVAVDNEGIALSVSSGVKTVEQLRDWITCI